MCLRKILLRKICYGYSWIYLALTPPWMIWTLQPTKLRGLERCRQLEDFLTWTLQSHVLQVMLQAQRQMFSPSLSKRGLGEFIFTESMREPQWRWKSWPMNFLVHLYFLSSPGKLFLKADLLCQMTQRNLACFHWFSFLQLSPSVRRTEKNVKIKVSRESRTLNIDTCTQFWQTSVSS